MSYTLNLYHAGGSSFGSVKLVSGQETARDLLHRYSDEQLASWRVPRPYVALVPRAPAKPWTRADIIPPETVMRVAGYDSVVIIDVRTIPPETVDADWLAERLPQVGQSARDQLLQRLVTFAPEQLELYSIREQPSGVNAATASASGLYDQVTIFRLDPTWPRESIHFEGEELFPYKLLPDDGGVEFRSGHTCEYRAVSEEARSTHAPLVSRIAHCKKLLADLPIALKNSESAMEAHAASDEVDLNTLGAMLMEQRRIRQEVADQRDNLKRLEEESDRARKSFADAMKVYHCGTTMTLPFGRTKVGDRTYHLQATALHGTEITGEASPRLHLE